MTATLFRTLPGTDPAELPYLAPAWSGCNSLSGMTMTTRERSGQVHVEQWRQYDPDTDRSLFSRFAPELSDVQPLSFLERHSNDPTPCDIWLNAEGRFGTTPPYMFRYFDCTPDGRRRREGAPAH